MSIPIDYTTLRVIWWVLLGVLLIGFAVMDGFDLGIGMLLPWVGRKDEERRVILNTIGPVWEGNQIWFILGGGAIFAAWPEIYAVSFSGFYFAMLMVLLALILRPVGFKYRSKIQSSRWRSTWDVCIVIAGFVPALIFGVAIGNVLQGVPFYYDETLRSFYTGTLLGLLNPFGLLCGLLSICMLCAHGALFLAIKTEGVIQERAKSLAPWFSFLTILLFAVAGLWLSRWIPGYSLSHAVLTDAPSNPLFKNVSPMIGAWLTNYSLYPWMISAPSIGFLGAFFAIIFVRSRSYKIAWLFSAFSIIGIIATVGVSMFPFILPSSLQPNMSLTVWDASSSHLTLFIMLIATLIFMPLILLYTSWVYYVLRGKVTDEYIKKNQSNVY